MASSPSPLVPLLLFFSTAVATASSTHEESTAPGQDTAAMTTHLHFYFHEITSGPNGTTVIVAGPPGVNASSLTTFGQVAVVDDMLREGPDPSSRLLGRAQGLAVLATLQGTTATPLTLLTVIEFVFTEGEFDGSTLEIMGRFVNGPKSMERSIVGGSGKFRMVRGYMLSTIVTPPPVPGYLLMVIDAYIVHN